MSDLLVRGFDLVIYGMGTVFVFLTLLVLVTMSMSSLLRTPATPRAAPADDASIDAKTRAAIGAAVYKYREKHRS